MYSICVDFILDFQEITVQKTKKQPKKSAAFGGRLLVLFWGLKYSHFLEVQNKIYTYWVYLMEHIFFGVQLCIKISIFNEKSNFWYSDHPEISPSMTIFPGSETVLVFGPELVSYESSRLIRRCILREISARVFFGKIPKYRKIIFPIFPGYPEIPGNMFQK